MTIDTRDKTKKWRYDFRLFNFDPLLFKGFSCARISFVKFEAI